MATPSPDEVPRWRTTLLAVPPELRSATQRDLIRGLELVDRIDRELWTPVPSLLADKRAINVLLFSLEAFLISPFELSAMVVLSEADQEKYKTLVSEMCYIGSEVVGKRTVPWSHPLTFSAMLALMLFCFHVLSHFRSKNPNMRCDLYVYFIDVLEGMNWGYVEQTLADSGLTTAVPREAMLFLHATYYLHIRCDLVLVRYVVDKIVLPTAREPEPSRFKLVCATKAFTTLVEKFEGAPRFAPFSGEPGSEEWKEAVKLLFKASEACLEMAERAVASAEAAGDDAFVALAAALLSEVMRRGMQQNTFADLKATVAKIRAGIAAVRPCAPWGFRQALIFHDISEMIEKEPDCNIVAGPAYYNTTGAAWTPGAHVETTIRNVRPEVHICGHCGAQSMELMACSGCHTTWYCNRRHQTAHWKAGHKAECAALRAAAQGGAAARGAAPGTPAAATSASEPKSSKKGKEGSKK